REFGGLAFWSIVSIAFGQTLLAACDEERSIAYSTNPIVGPKAAPIVEHWAVEMHEICSDLQTDRLSAKIWQERMEALFDRVEMNDLLKFIDFETLKKRVEMPDLGVGTRPVVFPKLEGLSEKTVFVKKIFGMKKGRAIVPHGHSSMASAHLILKGDFHLRHFEKLAKEGENLRIRPTIDRQAAAGDSSSISDERDNVHWFIANSDEAFTFDIIMLDLGGKSYDIHNIDIDAAERTGGDLLAPIIDVETALKKYGKQHHGPLA
ncbi:MAG: hypothetical protein J5I65_01805, partial [Aridibacter famidurans]|nr:hypothetical protein [Aridibacter famidurans]